MADGDIFFVQNKSLPELLPPLLMSSFKAVSKQQKHILPANVFLKYEMYE